MIASWKSSATVHLSPFDFTAHALFNESRYLLSSELPGFPDESPGIRRVLFRAQSSHRPIAYRYRFFSMARYAANFPFENNCHRVEEVRIRIGEGDPPLPGYVSSLFSHLFYHLFTSLVLQRTNRNINITTGGKVIVSSLLPHVTSDDIKVCFFSPSFSFFLFTAFFFS